MRSDIESGFALRDGRKIPRIGFGTFELAQGDETVQAVLGALEAGYRLIDCARLYANERSVGRALAESGISRDQLFVTSKVWNDRQLNGQVRQSCEETLTALGLEHLDLFLIHWPVEGCFQKTWEVLQELQEEGLTKSIGVSNFRDHHLQTLIDMGGAVPAVDQMEFNPYLQDNKTLAFCKEHGIVYEAWSPLGRGGCLQDRAIARIAQAHGADAGQVVLSWESAKGIVTLPRSSKPARIVSNLQALGLELTAEEMQALDALNCDKPVVEGVTPENFGPILNHIPSPHD